MRHQPNPTSRLDGRLPPPEPIMICPVCRHGEMSPSIATITLDRAIDAGQATTIVFRGVPARVCDNCGEQYVEEATASELLRQARTAAEAGVQLEVRAFKAA